jgi:tetratricopeptide (TPR) repeat protein
MCLLSLNLCAQHAAPPPPAGDEQQSAALKSVRTLIAQGKFQDADAQLREYLQAAPDSAEARSLLAFVLFREDRPQLSLDQYTQAAKLRKPTAEDLKTVALDYVLLNDYSDAAHWMALSLDWRQNDADSWYVMGRIKYALNRFQESVDCFERSLKLASRNVKARNNEGLALEGLNRNDEAVAAYHEAIAWQKDSTHPSEQPLLNLGIVLVNRGEVGEALPLLLQAEQIAPREHKIHEQLGRLYLKMDDLPKAQAEMEQAVTLSPDLASLHFQLGQIYKRLGMTDKARAEFARVGQLNGSHSSPE